LPDAYEKLICPESTAQKLAMSRLITGWAVTGSNRRLPPCKGDRG
jgi:hypothetical protein